MQKFKERSEILLEMASRPATAQNDITVFSAQQLALINMNLEKILEELRSK